MGTTKLTRTYHCWNDCQPQGCPGHTAELEYQSSSDALTFSDGKGSAIHMQTPELEAFLKMVASLATSRTEIESIVRDVLKPFQQPDSPLNPWRLLAEQMEEQREENME